MRACFVLTLVLLFAQHLLALTSESIRVPDRFSYTYYNTATAIEFSLASIMLQKLLSALILLLLGLFALRRSDLIGM